MKIKVCGKPWQLWKYDINRKLVSCFKWKEMKQMFVVGICMRLYQTQTLENMLSPHENIDDPRFTVISKYQNHPSVKIILKNTQGR